MPSPVVLEASQISTDLLDMDKPICYGQLYYVIDHERIILFKYIVKSKSSHAKKKFLMKIKAIY